MSLRFRYLTTVPLAAVVLCVAVWAQSRKLGPDTAKSISEAKLDPAFQTTKLDRVALLPWANTAEYKDAAKIISQNFVAQLSQMHSDYKFIPPEDIMNFVSRSHLDDQYNIFLGDYLNSGAARPDFIATLRDQLQIDAVFVGKITEWGQQEQTGISLGRVVKRKVWAVGMETGLYRTTDCRMIWFGKDSISVSKQDQLTEAAQTLSEVFARFFGRPSY